MQNTSETQQLRASETGESPSVDLAVEKKKQGRTAGLWLLDAFIYPIMNNFAVFAISVYATYMTKHGDKHGGKFNKWLQNRGVKLVNHFENGIFGIKALKMSSEQAEMSKMVFFSFLDGSIMAPFIKLFEDRREKIARGIDTMLGTVPEDESVYEAEPKQSWKSVLLGRAATAAIVVPTAVALDKIKVNGKIRDEETGEWKKGKVSLNTKLFRTPGEEWGEKFEENYPGVKKKFPKIEWPYLFKTGAFEAFYTTVCTVGLYFASRFIAGRDDKRRERKQTQKEENYARVVPAYVKKDETVEQKPVRKPIRVSNQKAEVKKAESDIEPEERSEKDKSHAARVKAQETAAAQTLATPV